MKKLYLLLTALLATTTAKADLTFYYGDQKIEPNETIYFNDIKKEDQGSVWDVEMHPALYLSSDIFSTNISITAECTSGQYIQMCAGGSCESGVTVTKTGIKTNANSKVDLEFELINQYPSEADIPTDVKVTFTAQDGNKTATKTTFYLVMNADEASLSLIEANAKPVRYTSAGLEYNIDGHANIALYDITGRQVLNVAAEGQGTVNTHTLRTGIYLYSIRNAGGAKHTGKIYVR